MSEDIIGLLTGNFVAFEQSLIDFLPRLGLAFLISVIGFLIIKVVKKATAKFFDKTNFDRTAEIFLERAIGIFSWCILITIVLGIVGVDVSGIIAGFGVMGFVIGFALKDTLSNLAAGIFILFFKPFKVGDWVQVNNVIGKVTSLGIAATDIITHDNTKVLVPNSNVWGGAIKNFTALKKLRLKELLIPVPITFDVKRAMKVITKLLDSDARVIKDPKPEVYLSSIDRYSQYITVKPLVGIKDYWSLRDDLPLKISSALKKAGIKLG